MFISLFHTLPLSLFMYYSADTDRISRCLTKPTAKIFLYELNMAKKKRFVDCNFAIIKSWKYSYYMKMTNLDRILVLCQLQ